MGSRRHFGIEKVLDGLGYELKIAIVKKKKKLS